MTHWLSWIQFGTGEDLHTDGFASPPSTGISACCSFFDREASTDALSFSQYLSNADTSTEKITGVTTGAINKRTYNYPDVETPSVRWNLDNHIYLTALLKVNNPILVTDSEIYTALAWMRQSANLGKLYPGWRSL